MVIALTKCNKDFPNNMLYVDWISTKAFLVTCCMLIEYQLLKKWLEINET
jgi:hypothetical protein